MFKTNVRWQHGSSVFQRGAMQSRSGVYVMIEASIKLPIFHVDLLIISNGKEQGTWKRYLVSSLAIVLEIFEDSRVANCQVSIQTSSKIWNDYKIFRIDEILSFDDIEGFKNLVYRCSDGTVHLDGVGPIEIEAKVEMVSLWKSKPKAKEFPDAELSGQ